MENKAQKQEKKRKTNHSSLEPNQTSLPYRVVPSCVFSCCTCTMRARTEGEVVLRRGRRVRHVVVDCFGARTVSVSRLVCSLSVGSLYACTRLYRTIGRGLAARGRARPWESEWCL
jgi:hypothetical protein